MDEGMSSLERIPREIRDKIYQFALLDPARPTLEGKDKSTKYKSYLGLLYVNKQMYEEVKAALEEIKPLFIISCNISNLGEEMIHHGIPYLSDHHVGRVKYHCLRLHVRFPVGRDSSKELKAYVVLREHLAETCLLLRGRSLDPANNLNQVTSIEDFLVSKMKIAVRLGSPGGACMLESAQAQLMNQIKWLNHAGGVTVRGCITDAVERTVQGYDNLVPLKSVKLNGKSEETLDLSALYERITLSEITDGKDSIEVASWKNAIAARAYRAKDYQLALNRYTETMGFIRRSIQTFYHHILMKEKEIFQKLDNCNSEAELGSLECCLELGHWEQAASNYKVFIKDITERIEYPPQCLIDRTVNLEMQLRAKLGADFDKEKSSDNKKAKGEMEISNETDRAAHGDGQDEDAEEQQI